MPFELGQGTGCGDARVARGQAEESGDPVGPDNLPYSCWIAGLMDLGDSASAIIDGTIESAKGGLNFSLSALSPAVTLLRFMCVAES